MWTWAQSLKFRVGNRADKVDLHPLYRNLKERIDLGLKIWRNRAKVDHWRKTIRQMKLQL